MISHVGELAYLHSRDITFAVLCQGRNTAHGPGDAQTSYDESLRYRTFMGWDMPWYSAQPSLDTLLVDRQQGLFHLVCYLRDGDRVFETYWTKRRGAEVLDYSYALMDLTVFGRQEDWEDSPVGWPRTRPRNPDPGRGSRVAAPVGVARRSSHLTMATARSRVLGRSGSGRGGCSATFGSMPLTGYRRWTHPAFAGNGDLVQEPHDPRNQV